MLELKHISKTFQDRIVLDDINFTLPDVGMIGIQGESGCGKSTLLYIIGMLDDHFDGEVIYNGEVICDREKFIRHHVSYMMQNNDMIASLNVKENIVLSCQVSGLLYTPSQLQKITTQLGIAHLLSRFPSQLSGGQFKRVSIAKALLKQSSLILADEPTGALHSLQSHDVMKQLQKLSKESLVIVVSHDPELLKMYCDHVLTLRDGKLKGRVKKKTADNVVELQQRHYSFFFYPIRQLLYQRNKLVFLFLFQWIVIVAFFSIVTAMNGVLDAIDMSEQSAVSAQIMTIEKKNGESFSELISHPLIEDIQYAYHLEQLTLMSQNQKVSCLIEFLPKQVKHIQLQSGRMPQTSHEVIVSDAMYQTLQNKKTIQMSYDTQTIDMNIVGVLKADFFTSQEIYCLSSLQLEIPVLKDLRTLRIEAKVSEQKTLYQQLSKDYFVYSEIIERVENYQSLLNIAKLVGYVFIGVSFLISLLLIGIVESTIYFERKHDVAYLLSLGMKKQRLFFLSLMESLSLGAIMATGGCLLSGLLFYYVNNVYDLSQHFFFSLSLHRLIFHHYDLYGVIFISYLMMTMLGAFIPMKKMMKIDMIDVLREE